MEKQQFIIDTLKPYFTDVDNCGFEDGTCKYITLDGRMCAVGVHLDTEREDYKEISSQITTVNCLLAKYGEDILKKESQKILFPKEWKMMQSIHDSIAVNDSSNLYIELEILEKSSGANLSELRNLIK